MCMKRGINWHKKGNKSADELEPRIDVDHDKPHSSGDDTDERGLSEEDDCTLEEQVEVVEKEDEEEVEEEEGGDEEFVAPVGVEEGAVVVAHQQVVDPEDVDRDDHIQQQSLGQVKHPREEIAHEALEDLVAEQREEDASHADGGEDQLADEDGGALARLVDGVDVGGGGVVVLEAVPAELVAAGAGHVGAAGGLLDGDLAARALVGQEEEVDEAHQRLQVQPAGLHQHCRALRAPLALALPPPARLHREHVVAALGGALLDVPRERAVLLEQELLQLHLVGRAQALQREADVEGLPALEGRNHLAAGPVGDLRDEGADVLEPAAVADACRAQGLQGFRSVGAVADLAGDRRALPLSPHRFLLVGLHLKHYQSMLLSNYRYIP